jgi:hypothetical protein
VALSKDVNNLGGLLAKAHADATVNVNAAGMSPTQLASVAGGIGAVDAISNLSLTSATVAADIDVLLGKTTGAVANATGMDPAQLSKLSLRAASIAVDGITGDVVVDSTVTGQAALFGRIPVAANVTVNASGMSGLTLAFIDSQIAKVDLINGLQLTNAQDKDRLGRLLGKSASASSYADGTGMSSNAGDQLAVLGDNSAKIASGGITGTFTVTGALTSAQLNGLLSKVFTGNSFMVATTVTINASGMTGAQLSAIAGNIAAVDLINSLTVGASQSSSELSALLGVAGLGQANVSATGMSSAQLAAVANAASGANDPVAGISGTFTVDSSLSAAQITALMSNTVAGQSQVTINTNGMSPSQQQAVFSTGILVVKSQQSVKVGDTVTIDIDVSGLPTTTVGIQASINYDASKLAYVGTLGGDDMPSLLYDSNAGTSVRFATGIAVGGPGSTPIVAGNLAKVQFTALVPMCSVTDCVSLTTSGFTNRLASSGSVSQPVPFVGTNLVNVTALNALQLANVTGDLDVAADAGTTAGAFVANPFVTATNSCGSVPVVLTITLPGGGTTNAWPSMFPIGTSTVTWRAEDAAQNVATVTKTYIVRNYQLATMDVSLSGVNSGNNAGFTHDVRVRLSDGQFVNRTMAFSRFGVGTVADVQIPVGSGYTCVSVKDAAHTLAAAATLPVVGTKYVPSAFILAGGDANDDNIRDILDYGAFVFDYGGGKNPSSRSNYNRDGIVGSADFTFISAGFLDVGAECGGGYANGNEPRDRVSVRDLRRAGMGDLAIADLNNDGWVDTKDVSLWMQGHRPAGYPTEDMADAGARAED